MVTTTLLAKASYERNTKLRRAHRYYEEGKQLYQQKSYSEAAQRFEDALAIQQTTLRRCHQDTILTCLQSGTAWCKVQNEKAALLAFHRATRLSEKAYDEPLNHRIWEEIRECWAETHDSTDHRLDHMVTIVRCEHQGDHAVRKKCFAAALESYLEAIGIQNHLSVGDGLDGADLLCKSASCHLELGQPEEASVALNAALDCYSKHLGTEHRDTLGVLASLEMVGNRRIQKSCSGSRLSPLERPAGLL